MEARHLELAAEFCEMVAADDLLAFLGLEDEASPEEAQAALKKKRSFYQSMQANPKHKDKAKFFIKHYRALDAVMAEPGVHLTHQAKQRASDKLPMLEMAIDSVLADGVLTPQEEAFIRDSADAIGIDEDTLERVLIERLATSGAVRADSHSLAPVVNTGSIPPPPPPSFGATAEVRTASPVVSAPEPAKKRRKASNGWWTQSFTDLLITQIPEGSTRMVDLACGSAWSALALLPERPELEYLGIDREEDRLQLARKSLAASPVGRRVALMPGLPNELPLNDDSVDVVLSIMALRYFYDTEPIFDEALRVLNEGGRFIVVEPDGLSQQFYFDGHLHVLNHAFREFMRAADKRMGETRTGEFVGRPGLAIGPELGARLRHTGFKPHKMLVYPIQGFREETVAEFAERVSRNIDAVSARAGLSPVDKPVRTVRRSLNNIVEMFGPEETGLGGHLQPAFICVGVKI
ncbi:MAG: methyltransferase domain-containing protein [Myxococcota bacterium]